MIESFMPLVIAFKNITLIDMNLALGIELF